MPYSVPKDFLLAVPVDVRQGEGTMADADASFFIPGEVPEAAAGGGVQTDNLPVQPENQLAAAVSVEIAQRGAAVAAVLRLGPAAPDQLPVSREGRPITRLGAVFAGIREGDDGLPVSGISNILQ